MAAALLCGQKYILYLPVQSNIKVSSFRTQKDSCPTALTDSAPPVMPLSSITLTPMRGFPAGGNSQLAAPSAQGHSASLTANLHLQSPLKKNRAARLRLKVRWRRKERKK